MTEPTICPEGRLLLALLHRFTLFLGFYCPEGSLSVTLQCPIGTFSSLPGLVNVTQCTPCPAGHYCMANEDGSGLTAPSGLCAAGLSGTDCSSHSEYQRIRLRRQCGVRSPRLAAHLLGSPLSCRHACRTVSCSAHCPAGSFCPEGTESAIPCPQGTYSSSTGLASSDDCTPCPAGYYCPTEGLTEATLVCSPGYYCPVGSIVATAIICPNGHFCPTGLTGEWIRGFPAFVWLAGPVECEAGSYAADEGQAACDECPEGFYCDTAAEAPIQCPLGFYCAAGTGSFLL
jgi:hypothetical protein